MSDNTLREDLAALCHQQWAGWMEYLFSKCETNRDGQTVIPAWAVARWRGQLVTPYRWLSTPEQDSERAQADKFLALIQPELDGRDAEIAHARAEATRLQLQLDATRGHQGDPCIYCGIAHDDVAPGPCPGATGDLAGPSEGLFRLQEIARLRAELTRPTPALGPCSRHGGCDCPPDPEEDA